MDVNGVSAKSLFSSSPDVVLMNTGSFGTVPKEIAEEKKKILDIIDRDPDHWYRHEFQRRFHAAADLVADEYRVSRDCLTLVENATAGVATVLLSLDLGAEDEILITSFQYGTVRMQCEDLSKRRGVAVHTLNISFPFSHDSICEQYENQLGKMQSRGRKVAIIDHITSQGAFLMPLQNIIRICKRHSVLSLVDGAHGPGQLTQDEMDISKLRPDFYAANLHKWAFVPRSCAFLYVSEQFRNVVVPPYISWLHNDSFRQRFAFRGTFDTANIACIPAAFRFTSNIGGIEAIRGYVSPLIRRGVRHVMEKLGGEPLCSEEYSAPFMLSFYLGKAFDDQIDVVKTLAGKNIFQEAMHLFLKQRGVICPVIGFLNDRCLIRVSAHIFTDMGDFLKLADGLEEVGEILKTMNVEDANSMQIWDWTEGKPLNR